MARQQPLVAVELFAGGGSVHAALARHGVRVALANDCDPMKARTYRGNFPGTRFEERPVEGLRGRSVPRCDILHASPPCQSFSVSRDRLGSGDGRGRLLFQPARLLGELAAEGRLPAVVTLENVPGLLTDKSAGSPFVLACSALAAQGYRVGAVRMDALDFVPARRERVFIVAHRSDGAVQPGLVGRKPDPRWHGPALVRAVAALPPAVRRAWVWWAMPAPPPRAAELRDVLDRDVPAAAWSRDAEIAKALRLLHPSSVEALEAFRRDPGSVGVMLKTTDGVAPGEERRRVLRADGAARTLVTTDGHAGQRVAVASPNRFGIALRRWTRGELARLTGLPDGYRMPPSLAQARRIAGDAVVVDVYAHLAEHLLVPLARAALGHPPPARPLPRRARAESRPGAARGNRPMKAACRAVIVYLPPEAHERLARAAQAAGQTLQEELLRAYDRELLAEGEPPLTRYAPAPRASSDQTESFGWIKMLAKTTS